MTRISPPFQAFNNPRSLLLIDGLGALLSAFLLGVILVHFENSFGMPRKALHFLAFWPCLFAIYDFACYFWLRQNWAPYLKAIAIANLLYCATSLAFLFYFYQQLTALGWIYFLLELVIVLLLTRIELQAVAAADR